MNAPPKQKIFPSDAKENAGIAVLWRGFLTKPDEKRSVLVRAVSKASAPKIKKALQANLKG